MDNSTSQPLPRRSDRVREHSSEAVNQRIDQLTEASVARTMSQGRDAVSKRIAELDREWDIDRALMLNFAVVGGTFFGIGIKRFATTTVFAHRRRKGFLYLFGSQLAFLAIHALVGWCPPAPVFRRLGYRTKPEIEAERAQLLKALKNGGLRTADARQPLVGGGAERSGNSAES